MPQQTFRISKADDKRTIKSKLKLGHRLESIPIPAYSAALTIANWPELVSKASK